MSELLPCPFCGGEVRLVYHEAEPKSEECEYKDTDECDDCYECGWHEEFWTIRHICKTHYWNHWTFNFDSDFCDTEAEAIAAWNTRYHSAFEETVIKAWEEIKNYTELTCHADEVTHRNCKYSINRGWRELTCHIVERQEEPQCGVLVRDYTFSCGHCICWAHTYEPRYCPNCGAKVVE